MLAMKSLTNTHFEAFGKNLPFVYLLIFHYCTSNSKYLVALKLQMQWNKTLFVKTQLILPWATSRSGMLALWAFLKKNTSVDYISSWIWKTNINLLFSSLFNLVQKPDAFSCRNTSAQWVKLFNSTISFKMEMSNLQLHSTELDTYLTSIRRIFLPFNVVPSNFLITFLASECVANSRTLKNGIT